MADEVRVKKVKAFPFAGTFKFGTVAIPGQVMKLTPAGFLFEITFGGLKTGEKFDCEFDLPVLHKIVTEPCVVVKLYTQWAGQSAGSTPNDKPNDKPVSPTAAVQTSNVLPAKTTTLVEAHFISPSPATREHVAEFLSAVQKAK